jgi:hypothetical protein
MRNSLLLFIFNLITGVAFGQVQAGQIRPSHVPSVSHHYLPEYTFDSPSDPTAWKSVQPGLNVSFASTDELYLRSEVPDLGNQRLSWEDTGWRGERLSAQLLVWSADTLEQVRVTVNDLRGSNGETIGRENVDVNMVRYVLSNYPYAAKDARCDVGITDTAYLLPDRFETFDRFSLPAMSVRPLWVSFNLPHDTEPGVYTGQMRVNTEQHEAVLDVRINVQSQVLPKPGDWTYRLDLWQNPWVVAWYYHVDPWSDEHKALLKKHLHLYADAGGKYITTYAVHSPWSDNSYMIEGTMIDWRKTRDGSWKFDYNIFDQYVELAMEVGIDEAITIYTPVPWGHRFRYLDEKSGNYVYAEWSPETSEFKQVWKVFLDDLHAHLKKKGWLNKTYLGINENPLNITIAAAKFIKAHSKDWRITYAGDWHAELTGLLDDYSPIIGKEPGREELADRKARGFTTTYYVCCTPPQPNNFVFSPPIEGTYISWYASAYGYDGFLRWAYDAWPADPLRDARHTLWPAGDCFMVYPGGISSIRFEKMREGIVDFEKIRIVKELARKSTDKKIKRSMADFQAHLETFVGTDETNKREYHVPEMREAVLTGKKMIDELSAQLAAVK